MRNDESSDSQTLEASARSARGRLHIIDIGAAPDLGVIVRVLNLLAVARADVVSIASHVEGAQMRVRVNARGLSYAQAGTLRWKVEAIEGVLQVRIASGK